MECSFYSFEYWSASDHRRQFSVASGALKSHVPDIHRDSHKYDFVKITMTPGSYLFIFVDEAFEEDCVSVLVQAPIDLKDFEKFCGVAKLNAGEDLYNNDKLDMGDFDWLKDYVVQKWQEDWDNLSHKRPHTIKAAMNL